MMYRRGRWKGLRWPMLGLAMAIAAGCSDPAGGTVQVSAEARARLRPHAGPNARDARGRPLEDRPLDARALVRGKVGTPSS